MKTRQYFQSSIVELEGLFKSHKDNIHLLEEIYYELQFRKTRRAIGLRKKIEELIQIAGTESKDIEIVTEINNNNVSILTKDKTYDIKAATNSRLKLEENNTIINYISQTINNISGNEKGPNHIPGVKQTTYSDVDKILASWLTLEVLTPQPLPKARELEAINRKLIRLDDISEPWNDRQFNKKGKETSVYWMIYLGELDLSKAVESILKVFPDEAIEERSEVAGNTTLGVIVLDEKGQLVEENMFLSSFAWGYGKVRVGKLKELATFTDAEKEIKSKMQKIIINQNEEGEVQPIYFDDIKRINEWLITELHIPRGEVLLPGVAVRVPQFSWYSEAPEPELLNSFFIRDIVKVRKSFHENKVGRALISYMGADSSKTKQDVVKDKNLLADTLAPERMPLCRWTGRGRYPLYLMQQAAINHAAKELINEGLVSVNGPPGTGKTTLLRDIVAKVVLDRAIAMAQFENPESAFIHTASMKTGKAFTHLYKLDDRLIGHEIVIASSNNKAVENISREIPSSSAIADDFEPPLKYFQAISDAVAADDDEVICGKTWGLAAAVLGNSANKAAFVKSFWWDKKRGMAAYLSAITGGYDIDNLEYFDETTEQSTIPEVVLLETPPKNEIEALDRWKTARMDFLNKLKKVKDLRDDAQKVYEAVNRKPKIEKQIEEIAHELETTRQKIVIIEDRLNTLKKNYDKALKDEYMAVEDRKATELLRPGFFSRLFRTTRFKEWNEQMVNAFNEVKEAKANVKSTLKLLEQVENEFVSLKSKIEKGMRTKTELDEAYESIKSTINEAKKYMGINLADDDFWQRDDQKLQMLSPWIFKDLQNARDDLFYSSFSLHRAFIDASAKYTKHNLRAVLEILKGRDLTEKQEPAKRSLWASLFMVVPVISTTFASTSRLFESLGKEELGWLLIDEAGQATPQAALGALWRAKRAVIIGDPLQIEPVVTMPQKLIKTIFSQFDLSNDEWAAPDVSAQILADRCSWFGTTLSLDDGELWVGSPLRVHRRCEQPMFSISNFIAYNSLMVYGTQPDRSQIADILGKSVWIDVDGNAIGKWCEDEGKLAVKILKKLLNSGISDPNIFFITPFRMVSLKLREMIRNEHSVASCLSKKVWEWTNERVGTIHTFQGKEADTVVLVLGAPLNESAGARSWAGGTPNLLNVAITRAKRRIYVIGNHNAWKNEGYFKYLASSIPVKKIVDFL